MKGFGGSLRSFTEKQSVQSSPTQFKLCRQLEGADYRRLTAFILNLDLYQTKSQSGFRLIETQDTYVKHRFLHVRDLKFSRDVRPAELSLVGRLIIATKGRHIHSPNKPQSFANDRQY